MILLSLVHRLKPLKVLLVPTSTAAKLALRILLTKFLKASFLVWPVVLKELLWDCVFLLVVKRVDHFAHLSLF